MPDEYSWLIHILSEISDADSIGWDSNRYAEISVQREIHDRGTPRWTYSDTTTMWQRYVDIGHKYKSDKKRNKKRKNPVTDPESFASDRLLKHINSTLGGLLGRMKEMGLIPPYA